MPEVVTVIQTARHGIKFLKVRPWDGDPTWKDRLFHCCPLCDVMKQTGGLTTPIDADWTSVHKECYRRVANHAET